MERLTRIETGFIMVEMDKTREWNRINVQDDAEDDDDPPAGVRRTPEQEYDANTHLLGRVFERHAGGDAFDRLGRCESTIRRES